MSQHSPDLQASAEKLLEDFTDVFSDTLFPNTHITGEEMVIELIKDKASIKPQVCTTTRPVPQHLQAETDDLVQLLLETGIIEPVPLDEVTDWILPAFFVPKEGWKGVRMVTDFTRLNAYVARPVHPFPIAHEITRRIPPGTKYFCKMDTTQGYHQIPLAKDATTTPGVPWASSPPATIGLPGQTSS